MEKVMTAQDLESQLAGKRWDTSEMQRDFEVLGFAYYLCVVRHKETGIKGSLDFGHDEKLGKRMYHSFVKG